MGFRDMTEIQTTEGASSSLLPALAFIATQKNKATVTSDLRKIAVLMGFSDWNQVNWATLNAANVGAVFAKIEGAPATRNRALSVLKGIAKAAWRLELLSSETLARINDISGDKGTREITGRNIEAWELIALMRNCGEDVKGDKAHLVAAGIRDAAIIALAANTGARREEIAAIKRADMTDKGDVVTIQMIGKRNKQRTVYVNNGSKGFKGLVKHRPDR
jgi:integrase/recombinase XerD